MRGDTNQKTYKILKRLLRKRFFKCILLSVEKGIFIIGRTGSGGNKCCCGTAFRSLSSNRSVFIAVNAILIL